MGQSSAGSGFGFGFTNAMGLGCGCLFFCLLLVGGCISLVLIGGSGVHEAQQSAERARARSEAERSASAWKPTHRPEASSDLRTWTDTSGAYTVRARFQAVADGKAKLLREDGKAVAIPLDRLSQADQDWIQNQTESKESAAHDETTQGAIPGKPKGTAAQPAPVAPEKPEPDPVNLENYYRIKTGMTLDEVKAILGPYGKENASAPGFHIVSWQQHGAFRFGTITITFQDGQVASKAQFGL